MEDTHVAKALIEKRAGLAGRIRGLEADLRQACEDLVHLDAAIKVFDPSVNLRDLPAKRHFTRKFGFEYGEVSRSCREALRLALEPLSSADIAARIIREKRGDPTDAKLAINLTRSVALALRDLAKAGKVEKLGHGSGVRWMLPTRGPQP